MREQPPRFRPGPTLKAGAIFAAFLLVFILIDRVSGPGGDGGGDGRAAPTTTAEAAPRTTAAPTTAAPTTAPPTSAPPTTAGPTTAAPTTAPPETTRPPASTRPPGTTPAQRPAEGVTLQILNGTGELRLARDFKPLARQEGYDIVNSGNANGRYPVSTVFYTSGHRADAEAFRARFPAFEVVAPAPGNLSDDVALHAVIGANYRP